MLGNIGNLFVKCMRQVTKGHLYHLLGVSVITMKFFEASLHSKYNAFNFLFRNVPQGNGDSERCKAQH